MRQRQHGFAIWRDAFSSLTEPAAFFGRNDIIHIADIAADRAHSFCARPY
jgi:hypothetical protein